MATSQDLTSFEQISRYLHFSDNENPRASIDKVWKIRPVLDVINATFDKGYHMGYAIAFDEGMIPNRSRMNPTRQYLSDKPHPWGTKFFMTCDGANGYCARY